MSEHVEGYAAADVAVAHVFVGQLDERCEITGDDGHHLQRVRRLRVGERVTAADGTGAWRVYELTASARGQLVLEARGPNRREPVRSPGVRVALALQKGGLDQVVARLTELGVEHVDPVRTARSVARWDQARAEGAIERLRTIARESAMQCRRATVPTIGRLVDVAALAGRPDLLIADRNGVPAAHLPPPVSGAWTVLVGPEGGLTPGDEDGLSPVGRLAVGPYVLRAETAPIAAVASLLARTT